VPIKSLASAPLAILCLVPVLLAQPESSPDPGYQPPSGGDRLRWFASSTIGPASDAGGIISAGWGTLFNTPHEYGTHWAGFGKRYGMRLSGIAVGNAIEAGLGTLWGEDPRYLRTQEAPFRNRIGHVVKMTFLATGKNGRLMPAYARYVAIPGNNLLSDAWRAPSDATVNRAGLRIGLGFLGRMAGNAFEEFWPDVRRRIVRRLDEPRGY
jgi:hypothetical protein